MYMFTLRMPEFQDRLKLEKSNLPLRKNVTDISKGSQ